MVKASVSDIWKWASEFRVEQILNRVDAEKRISVGKAAGSAVIHGQDIDLDRVYSHSGQSECVYYMSAYVGSHMPSVSR
ncbi:hypothetical protein PAECIP112173_04717 [Paenibacillus sp. JJ-100]|nr:hypothetical protein PAECIP112173_04717 [Paenibacillus sp. JJ-100]